MRLPEIVGTERRVSEVVSQRIPGHRTGDLGCESAYTGCQSLYPPSPFIIITQPES